MPIVDLVLFVPYVMYVAPTHDEPWIIFCDTLNQGVIWSDLKKKTSDRSVDLPDSMLGHGGGGFLASVIVLLNIKIGFVSVPAEYLPTRASDCNVSPPLTNSTWSCFGILWFRLIASFKTSTVSTAMFMSNVNMRPVSTWNTYNIVEPGVNSPVSRLFDLDPVLRLYLFRWFKSTLHLLQLIILLMICVSISYCSRDLTINFDYFTYLSVIIIIRIVVL